LYTSYTVLCQCSNASGEVASDDLASDDLASDDLVSDDVSSGAYSSDPFSSDDLSFNKFLCSLTCSIRISMTDTLIKILYTLNKCLAYPIYNFNTLLSSKLKR